MIYKCVCILNDNFHLEADNLLFIRRKLQLLPHNFWIVFTSVSPNIKLKKVYLKDDEYILTEILKRKFFIINTGF